MSDNNVVGCLATSDSVFPCLPSFYTIFISYAAHCAQSTSPHEKFDFFIIAKGENDDKKNLISKLL